MSQFYHAHFRIMIYLSILPYFLGLQVFPFCDGIFISEYKYFLDILKYFQMIDCKPCTAPFQSSVKLSKERSYLKVDTILYL